MERRLSAYTGCLLGLAAGDGLGHGPGRLNGYLPSSGYTQMAAYGCNGLLLGLTRGQMTGTMAPPVGYIAMALQEWADRQTDRRAPIRCWISRSDRMDYRRCPEPELLDVLLAGNLGTMEDHISTLNGPGALMAAVAVGLFFDPERLPRKEIQRLGAEAAALTHGDPAAFLSGAAVAHIISRIVWDGETDLMKLSGEAGAMLRRRFGREYHQVVEISNQLKKMRTLARWRKPGREEALAQIGSETAAQMLAAPSRLRRIRKLPWKRRRIGRAPALRWPVRFSARCAGRSPCPTCGGRKSSAGASCGSWRRTCSGAAP